MNQAWTLIISWVVLSGVIGFFLMGFDKSRAQGREWRVPERTFFTLALIGGAFGILLGSSVFHHKTLKGSFMGVITAFALMWVVALVELTRVLGLPVG